jgi:hypothetical protein
MRLGMVAGQLKAGQSGGKHISPIASARNLGGPKAFGKSLDKMTGGSASGHRGGTEAE